jgi:hypothetical protein
MVSKVLGYQMPKPPVPESPDASRARSQNRDNYNSHKFPRIKSLIAPSRCRVCGIEDKGHPDIYHVIYPPCKKWEIVR